MASIEPPFRLRVVSDSEDCGPAFGEDLASLISRADRASITGDRRGAERLLAKAYVAFDSEARRGTLLRIADAAGRLGLPNVAGELCFLADDDRCQGLRSAAYAVRRWEKNLASGARDRGEVSVSVGPVLVKPVLVEPIPSGEPDVAAAPHRPGVRPGPTNPRSPGHVRPVAS